MTSTFDKVLTLLTGVAVFAFMVLNGDKVATLSKGMVDSAVTYVRGIATVGGSAAA